jgi:cyclopropane fatty-acyl-phospholipid synthase-like methyltransferase
MGEAGNASSAEARDFYDEYAGRQAAVGVNERHRAILEWALKFGMRPDHSVLELGCGVGTLTSLLAGELGSGGSVTGIDLSPVSVESAKERLSDFANVRLIAADVLEVDLEDEFDVVVLPDVIEHIPLESHRALFARVAAWVRPNGFVLLHYPSPHYQEWNRVHHPDRLQIIDQTVHVDVLSSNTYPNGLYIDRLATYSIWMREGDYVVAVLRPLAGPGTYTELPPPRVSPVARVAGRLRRLVK